MGYPHMVFLDQLSFHFILDIDTSQYLALHDLINSVDNLDSIFVCKTEENEDENKLYITFLEEHISSNGLKL